MDTRKVGKIFYIRNFSKASTFSDRSNFPKNEVQDVGSKTSNAKINNIFKQIISLYKFSLPTKKVSLCKQMYDH